MKFSRIMTLVCAFLLSISIAFAQSSGDKLYNQGLQLQKVMTVKSQNSAIAKFQSAKKLYDSAAKKAQCDQAISVSRNIISSLSSSGGSGKVSKNNGRNQTNKQTQEVKEVEVVPSLTLTNNEFNLDLNSKKLQVGVTTNQPSWNVTVAPCEDGSSFVNVEKNGSSSFDISVASNPYTLIRTQKVIVTAGDLRQEVTVNQTGKKIELDVDNKILKFKEKGGKKNLKVSCNADYVYQENSDLNWFIESKPDWVQIVINKKSGKSTMQQMGDAALGTVSGWLGIKKSAEDASMQKTSITLNCDALKPGTREAHDGRNGEVVIKSGDKSVIIYVTQYGKASQVK